RRPLSGVGGMSLQPQEVAFDLENLQKIIIGMIYEYSTYQSDKKYKTEFLKDTTIADTMLLDGIMSRLPDYHFLKCVLISKKDVVIYFKDHLNTAAIKSLISNANVSDLKFEETKTARGKNSIDFLLNDSRIFRVEDYGVIIPYLTLSDPKSLAKGVKFATELTTRIHQDILLRDNIKRVNFAEYASIFKMLFPELFEDKLTGFLKTVRDLSINQQIPQIDSFHETTKSKLFRREKKYAFEKSSLPDHIEYLVVCPDKQELYIRFGSKLDYNRIQEMFKKQGLQISEQKAEKIKNEVIIKKGGGSRKKTLTEISKDQTVFDAQGRKILDFQGYNIVKLYFSQDNDQFDLASKIVGDIYYNRLLYTTWLNHSDFKSDLTPTERKIIMSVENLVMLYRIFLDVDEQKLAFASNKKFLDPIQWITAKMQESPNTTFEERVLYTINEMDNKIDPQTFYKYGNASDTLEKINKCYSALQQLKGRFEGVCAAIKTLT
ncbi:MAG: hypothetical protein AABX39_00285, partial [Nanoarchaeota archaeon]